MTDLAIPDDWDSVTAEWMTKMLAASHPGVAVSSVDLVLRDDGTNRRARFALDYSRGVGPAQVFLKAVDPDHAELNRLTGGLFNEVRLFNSGVVIPCEHPEIYGALVDEPGLNFVMVMEDVLTRGADPRDATRPLSIDQAASGVRALARLHTAFWDHQFQGSADLAWVEPYVAWVGVMGAGIDMGIERCHQHLPSEVQRMNGSQIEADYWAPYIGTVAAGPQTLLHGDAHVGNTYVLPDDEVGFLDWQVLRRGNHVIDLGYFLQGAVTVDDRRAHERDLVAEYLDALIPHTGERPILDDVWLRYRASASHGLALWLATASGAAWQRPEVSLALAERYAAAFVDLETADAVATLCS